MRHMAPFADALDVDTQAQYKKTDEEYFYFAPKNTSARLFIKYFQVILFLLHIPSFARKASLHFAKNKTQDICF